MFEMRDMTLGAATVYPCKTIVALDDTHNLLGVYFLVY